MGYHTHPHPTVSSPLSTFEVSAVNSRGCQGVLSSSYYYVLSNIYILRRAIPQGTNPDPEVRQLTSWISRLSIEPFLVKVARDSQVSTETLEWLNYPLTAGTRSWPLDSSTLLATRQPCSRELETFYKTKCSIYQKLPYHTIQPYSRELENIIKPDALLIKVKLEFATLKVP